jgi:predicted acetyltransferase
MDDTLIRAHHDLPVDAMSAARAEAAGLRLVRLDNDDPDEFAAWQRSVARGFFDGEPNEARRRAGMEFLGYRRLIAVLDPGAPDPQEPVATFATWAGGLSVPGGEVPSCAVSSVTVAPTHRRRGLARAMMEGELRTAVEAGLPVASLTVSESTLYGRYGFGSAASAASLTIDTKRAGWAGPVPAGRVDFISRERWRALAPDVFDRVRAVRPGEFEMPGGHWDRFAGTRPDAEKPELLRAVQYADPAGTVQGLALYRIEENEDDWARSRVQISSLIADGDDAYAALWRYFVEMDLIGTVRIAEQTLDEPLLWMVADRRAVTVTVRDHHYVRILDVPAALQGRRYEAPGRFRLEVADPLGIAAGTFALEVDAQGTASVREGDDDGEALPVRLGVTELSALYLGEVSALTLARAGRLSCPDPVALARTFRWSAPANLSYWY